MNLLSLTYCCQATVLLLLFGPIVSVTSQLNGTLTPNSTVNATTTLVSKGGVFELGFSAGVQSNLPVYTLAIWYANAPNNTVVWVADRSMALRSNTTASFSLSAAGDLEVHGINSSGTSDSSPTLVWTSNTTNLKVVSATMEDTGNLVLRNAGNVVVWQSFDSPTDTLLPNQTFAANSSRAIIALANDRDWREGNYSLWWAPSYNLTATWRFPYSWHNSKNVSVSQVDYWYAPTAFIQGAFLTPAGLFQGVDASGNVSQIGTANVVGVPSGRLVRLTLDKDGNLRMYSWSVGNANWTVQWKLKSDECDISGYCGPYAVCNTGGLCSCPPNGFQFVDANDQRLGCKRIDPRADCTQTGTNKFVDTFAPAMNADWPSNDLAYFGNENISTCMQQCLASCNCSAVVAITPDSSGVSSWCYLKQDALLNGKPNSDRQSYMRVAGNESLTLPGGSHSKHKQPSALGIVASTLGAAVTALALLACVLGSLFAARQMQKSRQKRLHEKWVDAKGVMIRFKYAEIELMTDKFGTKIGEGGFGTVFKGHIGNDVTVAVKRLNKELSSQMEKEFANEVDSIGLIHHVHLVSLLGYCAEAHHRLLVYEYVERGSLDRALFIKGGLPVLEWRPRFAIAIQTARGLAYLHEDCHQQIIHCDVKPENILLDHLYNVKVADFGISRIMERGHKSIMTMQIRGTRGYLAPEWMMEHMSITNKVDVFSYGMVLLEMISGRRNLMADRVDAPDLYFPSWAYPKIETEAFMDVVDPALTGIVKADEVRRALQVAFWCINGNPHMRPAMSEVVQMLQGHVAIQLPVPKPDFFKELQMDVEDDADSEYTALRWSSSGNQLFPSAPSPLASNYHGVLEIWEELKLKHGSGRDNHLLPVG